MADTMRLATVSQSRWPRPQYVFADMIFRYTGKTAISYSSRQTRPLKNAYYSNLTSAEKNMIFSNFSDKIQTKYEDVLHAKMRLRDIPLGLHDNYGTKRSLVCISNATVWYIWCGDHSEAPMVQNMNLRPLYMMSSILKFLYNRGSCKNVTFFCTFSCAPLAPSGRVEHF